MKHRSGFVNIIGNPNVGKSTLVNALMGGMLSITNPKAQTTRHRIFGLLNHDDYQIVFSDTPGIIKPAYGMQEAMMQFVRSSFEDADLILYVIEIGEKGLKDEKLYEKLKSSEVPVVVVLNKIDKVDQQKLEEEAERWSAEFPDSEIIPASALNKFGMDQILDLILSKLPEGPAYYPKDSFTDRPERFFVSEIMRDKILQLYDKEIPYSCEVEIEEFKEEEDIIRIRSVIHVARQSQKGIIIGHQGKMLKRLGTMARKDLEKFFGKKIYLEQFVKVSKNWRDDKRFLRSFGYDS
jgi:GTP-binding protein Era